MKQLNSLSVEDLPLPQVSYYKMHVFVKFMLITKKDTCQCNRFFIGKPHNVSLHLLSRFLLGRTNFPFMKLIDSLLQWKLS